VAHAPFHGLEHHLVSAGSAPTAAPSGSAGPEGSEYAWRAENPGSLASQGASSQSAVLGFSQPEPNMWVRRPWDFLQKTRPALV
jgi:hypothetical protein